MKSNLLVVSLVFVALSSTTFAADINNHRHAMHEHSSTSAQLIDGVVKKVDQNKSRVTLKHGEIKEVQMPAMVMNFQVKDASQLALLHKGDKVRFAVEKVDGKIVVIHIELAK